MTTAPRYLIWFGAAAAVLGGLALASPAEMRREVSFAVLLAIVLQGPLGWWAVNSLGTARFVWVWGFGLLMRFGVVGLVALGVVPAVGWAPGPVLLSLVGALIVLLAVEAIAAAGHDSSQR